MCDNNSNENLKEHKHHMQEELCKTRPPYRQGRKLTAVKTYTINNESQHLFVYGVPKINLRKELKQLFANYGQVLQIHVVADHKTEIFTECFHVQFDRIQSARIAKRVLDNRSFYGGLLHVCYAPEHESIEETRTKLKQRCKDVLSRINGHEQTHTHNFDKKPVQNRKRKYPAVELNEEQLNGLNDDVWEGIPQELDPRLPPPKNPKLSEPKKHYQLADDDNTNKGVIYGPHLKHILDNSNVTSIQLIPTQVKVPSRNIVKRIVFRKK